MYRHVVFFNVKLDLHLDHVVWPNIIPLEIVGHKACLPNRMARTFCCLENGHSRGTDGSRGCQGHAFQNSTVGAGYCSKQ